MGIIDIIKEEIQIFEGYKDVDGLTRLADDIINYFSEYNWRSAEGIFRDGEINGTNLEFDMDMAYLGSIEDSLGIIRNYGSGINGFVKRFSLVIEFKRNFNTSGRYYKTNDGEKHIKINLRIKKYLDYLYEHLAGVPGSFGKNEFKKILKDAMMSGLRATIVHELQHAYDDYRSKGNFDKDPASKKYYADVRSGTINIAADVAADGGKHLTTYYNLPHEYWARFSDALSQIDTSRDFNTVLDDFKQNFDGYNVLNADGKKRILNSLYKYYHNKEDNKVMTEEENVLKKGTPRQNLKASEVIQAIKNVSSTKSFYAQFNDNEIMTIIEFLLGVYHRQNSGTGEGIGKQTLRNLFFKTPEAFRTKYDLQPSGKSWRGDVDNPCTYTDYSDNEFYLQSFGNQNAAKFFGSVIYPATTIKSYGGCFATPMWGKLMTRNDDFYIIACDFYFESIKNGYEYKNFFTREEFVSAFYILRGYGVAGRKYKNVLLKFLKENNMNFVRDYDYISRVEEGSLVGDDENEIFYFDVIYDCEKMKKSIITL